MENEHSLNKKILKVPNLAVELFQNQKSSISYSTQNPPPFFSTSEVVVTENGNSDPNFIRSTMYTIPSSEYTLDILKMPLSLVFTPFNDKGIYNMASSLDVCKHCRSYVNCFTTITEKSFKCNICQSENNLVIEHPENTKFPSLESYLSPTQSGKPLFNLETNDNPEDLIYPQIQTVSKPVFIFMFDMMSVSLINNALDLIENLVKNPNFQFLYENVGFLILNGGINSFSFSNGQVKKIKMLSNFPFITPNILFKTTDSDSISKILNEIRNYKERKVVEKIPLIQSLIHISAFCVASKICIFSSQQFDIRYEDVLANIKNSSINLFKIDQPEIPQKTKNQLETLAFYSSGSVFKYKSNCFSKLRTDLESIALSKSAFDIDFVLKVSDNLTKNFVVGSTLHDNISLTHFNHMSNTMPIMYNLGLTGISKATKYIQLQIKFTDYDGTRKLRLINHSFPTGLPSNIFPTLSFDTLFCALIKNFIYEEIDIEEILTNFLVYYRSKCSNNASSSQFVLPESIKCLPVLVQAFYKKSSWDKVSVVNFNVEQTLRYFYPRIFSLSDYALNSDLLSTTQLNLSIGSLSEDDIYILEDSQKIFIYVPRSVDRALVEKLFMSDSDGKLIIIKSDDEENSIVNRIIYEINEHYNYELDVNVCLAGESLNEAEFLMMMCEDPLNNLPDYPDYIFKIHFKIQKG